MVPTSYATPRGPGGVFGALALSDFAGYFVRGSWGGQFKGAQLKGVLVRKPAPNEDMRGFESAESWIRTRCREGKSLFVPSVFATTKLGGVAAGDRALMATGDQGAIDIVTRPEWIAGEGPMEPLSCPAGPPAPRPEDTRLRSALLAGGIVAGTWVVALGIYFLGERKL